MNASAQNSTNATQSSGWCSITISSSLATMRWTSSTGSALAGLDLVFMKVIHYFSSPRTRGPVITCVDDGKRRLLDHPIERTRHMGPAPDAQLRIRRGRPGLLQRLQRVVLRLAPAGAGRSVIVQRNRRLAESLAVDLNHGLAELAQLIRDLLLGLANLIRRFGGGLHQNLVEHLLVA